MSMAHQGVSTELGRSRRQNSIGQGWSTVASGVQVEVTVSIGPLPGLAKPVGTAPPTPTFFQARRSRCGHQSGGAIASLRRLVGDLARDSRCPVRSIGGLSPARRYWYRVSRL